MRKIAFVVNNLDYGGAQKMIAYLANSCTRYFTKVYVISLSKKKTNVEICQDVNVEKIGYTIGKSRSKKIVNKLFTAIKLYKFLKKKSPDILCVFGPDALLLVNMALRKRKYYLVSSERNSPLHYSSLWQKILPYLYNRCDKVVFQTEGAMNHYSESIKAKSEVIPNPYIKPSDYVIPLVLEAKHRKKKITCAAASFEHRKGIDVLIAAYARLRSKHPEYELEIFGKGELLGSYLNLVKKLDIEKYVIFPGTTVNVVRDVFDSAVFVLPSRNEGMPNVLIEVMGAGIPTVSTNCPSGGPAFLTNNGERGLLVNVDDEEAMANSILKIIESDELSNKLSQKGREIVRILDINTITKLWVDLFLDCKPGFLS